MEGENEKTDSEAFIEKKQVMIRHAETVINSPMFAIRISRLTGIHYQLVYSLKRKSKSVKELPQEYLVELNKLYHTHAYFENTHRKGR